MQCPGCWAYGLCPTHTAGGLRLEYECACGQAMVNVDLRGVPNDKTTVPRDTGGG